MLQIFSHQKSSKRIMSSANVKKEKRGDRESKEASKTETSLIGNYEMQFKQ